MATQILMPALSPTMTEGRLAKWLKKEGDQIASGDIIAEIETDKATMEYEAVDEGRLAKILVGEGTEGIAVNTPIAILAEDGESVGAAASAAPPAPPQSAKPPAAQPSAPAPAKPPAAAADSAPKPAAPPPAPQPAPDRQKNGRIFITPLARRLAKERGLDPAALSGSGPHGRIIARDITAAPPAAAKQAPPQTPAPASAPAQITGQDQTIKHDMMRRTMAKRLVESVNTIPHFSVSIDCELDRLLALRKEINALDEGTKISVNDFVIRASALALQKVPEVNASWTDTALIRHAHSDIAMAVALEGGLLITPIIFRAETKSLREIAHESKDLAERARKRKLRPEEYQGGSFSVSNLGMFGAKSFTSIINPPHAAILSVGAGEERAVVKDGKLVAATMMTVTIAIDHRVMGGAEAARWLQAFKAAIEQPLLLVL